MSRRRILSLVPYKILPVASGGQRAIFSFEEHLGRIAEVHMAGTPDNAEAPHSFTLHRVFASGARRYLPGAAFGPLSRLIREHRIDSIICEHPYMFPTAMLLSVRHRIPWYIRMHNIESERFRELGKPWWKVLRGYERMALRLAAKTFHITQQDRDWAIEHFSLGASSQRVLPMGVDRTDIPPFDAAARETVARAYGLDASKSWLYFMGVLDYGPNREAARMLIEEIHPRLRRQGFDCELILAGKGLPEELRARAEESGMKYLGFVEHLDLFLRSMDMMVNPVIKGGGVKVKAVEALGYSKKVVSTIRGAYGIDAESAGANLTLVPDGDWDAFANAIVAMPTGPQQIPQAFFERHYWGNIAAYFLRETSGSHT